MKLVAAMSLALCVVGLSAPAFAQAKLCDAPKQMEGFKP